MTTSVKDAAPPRIRQGHLSGPSRRLDARINAVRADLADLTLVGSVIAPRYTDGVAMTCGPVVAMLHASPDSGSIATTSLLPGEAFTVFDFARGWAWGQCGHDGYVGWVLASSLGPTTPVSHRVSAVAANVFAAPDIKSKPVLTLPLNALIAVKDGLAAGDFAAALSGFIHRRHLAPKTAKATDPVRLALGFVGSPYVWGGRTRDGIDCSGLTQAVLLATGIACPRDSDQQTAEFPAIDPADRCRGDLVFFPGHVGILADADTLIHANAWWMATVVEPLADVAARLAPSGFARPV